MIIHNSGIANGIYLQKAGVHARAKEGEKLVIDQQYFDHVAAIIKRVSGIISRDAQEKFDKPTEDEISEA